MITVLHHFNRPHHRFLIGLKDPSPFESLSQRERIAEEKSEAMDGVGVKEAGVSPRFLGWTSHQTETRGWREIRRLRKQRYFWWHWVWVSWISISDMIFIVLSTYYNLIQMLHHHVCVLFDTSFPPQVRTSCRDVRRPRGRSLWFWPVHNLEAANTTGLWIWNTRFTGGRRSVINGASLQLPSHLFNFFCNFFY